MNDKGAWCPSRGVAFTMRDLLDGEQLTIEWLITDILPMGKVGDLRGAGGAGKTTLAAQLCASTLTGRSWLGMPVRKGAALYVTTDEGKAELQATGRAVAVDLGVTNEEFANFHLWSLEGEDAALMAPSRDGAMAPTPLWGELVAYVEHVKPVLVVLDHRAAIYGGGEIDRLQVAAFLILLAKLAKRSGAFILLLSHPSLTGLSTGTGNSGSTQWTNNVRVVLHLHEPEAESGDIPDPDARVLQVLKANRGPLRVWNLRWAAGTLVLADDPVRNGPRTTQEREAEAEMIVLHLLAKFDARNIRARPGLGRGYAPGEFAKEREAKAVGLKVSALRAAMLRLIDAGQIEVRTEGSPSKQTRFLAKRER